jgi:hypothetical protein
MAGTRCAIGCKILRVILVFVESCSVDENENLLFGSRVEEVS